MIPIPVQLSTLDQFPDISSVSFKWMSSYYNDLLQTWCVFQQNSHQRWRWAAWFTVYARSCWGKVLPCREVCHATSQTDLQHQQIHTNTHRFNNQFRAEMGLATSIFSLTAVTYHDISRFLQAANKHAPPVKQKTESKTTAANTSILQKLFCSWIGVSQLLVHSHLPAPEDNL